MTSKLNQRVTSTKVLALVLSYDVSRYRPTVGDARNDAGIAIWSRRLSECRHRVASRLYELFEIAGPVLALMYQSLFADRALNSVLQ